MKISYVQIQAAASISHEGNYVLKQHLSLSYGYVHVMFYIYSIISCVLSAD